MMTKERLKRTTKEYAGLTIKVLIGLLFISPLIICLLFSFQPNDEVGSAPLHLFTSNPTLENYIYVLTTIPMGRFLFNTLAMCVVCIGSQLVLASLAAYALVFFNFRGKKLLFGLILMSMMIPGDVVVITNYITVQQLRLVDTFRGLVITGLCGGGSIFMMRQYYMTLPKELKEAATIDGCGDMRFLLEIAVPLSVPTCAALAINAFIHTYNAYFWPLLVTTNNTWRTIQVGMADLMGGELISYGHVLAGAVVCMLPSVFAFIYGQDYILKGMTTGSLKG